MSMVSQICGEYPVGFEKLDIASDPNFVFVPDPNYQSRKVFDADGNSAFVNSFIECEHYVSGGWDKVDFPIAQSEQLLQNYLVLGIAMFVIVNILINRFIKNRK